MTISDINQEIWDLTDSDSTSYSTAKLLRRVNAAYEEVVGDLIALDDNWAFGDTNYSSLPVGTATLVAGTREYAFDSALLTVNFVRVMDADGIWQEVDPVDESEVDYNSSNGFPIKYAKREGYIVLDPPPSATACTLTNGLKVRFQRTADLYTSAQVATGTKTPGFASPYHIILAYKTALPYCLTYKKDRVPMIMAEIKRLHDSLIQFYTRRAKDERPRLTPATIPFR